MGSRIVKIFFSEDPLIHVMRFPTTISSRVGLARDSEMEQKEIKQKKIRINKNSRQSQQRAFIIRAPTLEATSHLTFDIPGDGPTWHFLASFAMKTAATQKRGPKRCTDKNRRFSPSEMSCACFARCQNVTPRAPPPPPRIVLYQRLKSMQSDLKTRFFSGPQCTKIDGQTERPLRQC